jgi:uncharacterized protein
MRIWLASPAGFLIGVSLGALGGGGSILAVPALVFLAGQDPAAATTTSLLVVGSASLLGAFQHARAGRVRVASGVLFGLAGVGGSLAGSRVNAALDGDVLLLAFSGLVLVAAWRMITGCPSCTRVGEERAVEDTDADDRRGSGALLLATRIDAGLALKVGLAGTAVGFLTGLFGVGGGFVIVPALTLVLGFTMAHAVGTSLLVIAINAATALAVRLGTTGIEWRVALPFTIAAMAGVLTGTRIADRLPAAALLRWFAGLLVAVAIYTAASSLAALTT